MVDTGRATCTSCAPGRGWIEQGPGLDKVCVDCTGFDYSPLGVCAPCEAPNIVSADHTSCTACVAGFGPNANRTECLPCSGVYFSTTGVCQECTGTQRVNWDHTACAPPFKCPIGSTCPPSLGRDCLRERECLACEPGSASLGVEPCLTCNASGEVANEEQSVCISCFPGQEPNAGRTDCSLCTDNTVSAFGIQCDTCVLGYLADYRHVQCEDEDECATNNGNCDRRSQPVDACPETEQCNAGTECPTEECASTDECVPCSTCANDRGSYRCGLCPLGFVRCFLPDEMVNDTSVCRTVLTARLNGTRCFLPPIEEASGGGTGAGSTAAVQPMLKLAVDLPGQTSASYTNTVEQQMRADIAASMNISINVVEVEIHPPPTPAPASGRRRMQTSMEAAIVVTTSGEAGLDLMAGLQEQLGDPSSPLINSMAETVVVPPGQDLSVRFECPRGTVTDGNQCKRCPPKKFSEVAGQQCISCPAGQTNNAMTDGCECLVGYYSSPTVEPQPTCVLGDQRVTPGPTRHDCEQLSKSKLVDCVEDATGAEMVVKPGWTVERPPAGGMNIFKCRYDDACPGGIINETQPLIECADGYGGTICGSCLDNYMLKSDGNCMKCGDTTWQGLLFVMFCLIVIIFLASKVKIWCKKTRISSSYTLLRSLNYCRLILARRVRFQTTTSQSAETSWKRSGRSAFNRCQRLRSL